MDTKATEPAISQMLTILAQTIEADPAWGGEYASLKTLVRMLPEEVDAKLETKLRTLRTIYSMNTTRPHVFAEAVNRVIGYVEAKNEKEETPKTAPPSTDIEEWNITVHASMVLSDYGSAHDIITNLRKSGCKGKINVTLSR